MNAGKWLLLTFAIFVLLGCTQNEKAQSTKSLNEIGQEIGQLESEIDESENESLIESGNITEEVNESNASENITGLLFGDGKYILLLGDIVLDQSKPDGACAAVKIIELTGNETAKELGKEKVCKDADVNWFSPEGRIFRIRLIKIVPGYSQQPKWAEFRIFG